MSLKDSLEIIARDIDILDQRVDRLERVEQVFTIYAGEVVVNEAGIDVDTRFEGSTDPNLLFIDTGTERIGIKTNTPAADLHMFDDDGSDTFQLLECEGANCVWRGDVYSNVAANASYFFGRRYRGTIAAPAAIITGNTIFVLRADGYDGAGVVTGTANISFSATENWNAAAHGSKMTIRATSNGAVAAHNVAILQDGIQVGAPAGGDKGVGTINVAADIYKNNVAYVNPDFVLEHYYRGKIEKFIDNLGAKEYEGLMNLLDVDKFMNDNLHLPQIPREPMGIFDRSDAVLLHLEQIYLYLIEHEKRLNEVEHGD